MDETPIPAEYRTVRWAPPPPRTRPGYAPLPADVARAARLVDDWCAGLIADDAITGAVTADLLHRPLDVDPSLRVQVLDRLSMLRREGAGARARLDAPCDCEHLPELCTPCWQALGSWWNHVAAHLGALVREHAAHRTALARP